MTKDVGVVILAAGEGRRLKISHPKPLAPIMDGALIDYPILASKKFFERCHLSASLNIVVGFQKEVLIEYLNSKSEFYQIPLFFAHQKEQKGTADALKAYFDNCEDSKLATYTLVMCSDTPMIQGEDLERLYLMAKEKNLDGIVATFSTADPFGLGRILRNEEGMGLRIVEEKDATEEQKKINEVNSGLYLLKTSYILERLEKIENKNSSGEFYLTDLFTLDSRVYPLCFEDSSSFLGVNDLGQLEKVETLLRIRHMKSLRDEGVRFINLADSYVNDQVKIGKGSLVYPNVFIEGKTDIGENVILESGVCIKDSVIEDNVQIKAYSHLENSVLRKKSVVGPFARLRPGTDVGSECKIGNFVEIKESVLSSQVKVSHLSYVGDAEIGENSNIGCGFITCNYDGKNKHKTMIGKNCFIGSDSQAIAPLEIGDDCFVASGTTITQKMESGDFAISRGRQTTKKGMAKKFLKNN